MSVASSEGVGGGNVLYYSFGGSFGDSVGVRPIVSLNSMLQVDISDERRDGSLPEKAWKVLFDSNICA